VGKRNGSKIPPTTEELQGLVLNVRLSFYVRFI